MTACYKDRLEPCHQDCKGCDRYMPHCDNCGTYDGDLYEDEGQIYCESCLIERYSKRDGKNLFDEFLRDYSDEYKQYILEYFEDCKEDCKVGDDDE